MSLSRNALPLMILAPLLLAPLATGCGRSASGVAPEPAAANQPLSREVAADIATQLGVTLARDFGGGPGAIGASVTASLDRTATPSRAFSDTSSGGLWFRIVVRYFDADGNEQPSYDPQTTARLTIERRVRGGVSAPGVQIGMGSAALLDVNGILPSSDRYTTNGSSNDSLAAHFQAEEGKATRDFYSLASGALEDVVQLKPVEENPWPLSGVLRYAVDAALVDTSEEGTAETHYYARATVTFNGTPNPVIEFEEGWRFVVDLRTGQVLPA